MRTAVGDLGLRLLERLSHLERQEEGKLLDALVHELEGPSQDLAPLSRRVMRPLPLDFHRGVERGHGVFGSGVRHLAQHLPGRGILYLQSGT
jgi:hypothetical protein